MKATTKAMAILLALAVVPVYADRDGTDEEHRIGVTRSPAVLAGEMNDRYGAGLPDSESCVSNCVELAVLGDRFVVLARDVDGIPFVAVTTDHEGSWSHADRTVFSEDAFPVLDAWFLERNEAKLGVVALDGTPVAYAVDVNGELRLDLALRPIERPARADDPLTNDAQPELCPTMYMGSSHEHRSVLYCECYGTGPCYYTYMMVIETHDCMGNLIGVSYQTDTTEISCHATCPCTFSW